MAVGAAVGAVVGMAVGGNWTTGGVVLTELATAVSKTATFASAATASSIKMAVKLGLFTDAVRVLLISAAMAVTLLLLLGNSALNWFSGIEIVVLGKAELTSSNWNPPPADDNARRAGVEEQVAYEQ